MGLLSDGRPTRGDPGPIKTETLNVPGRVERLLLPAIFALTGILFLVLVWSVATAPPRLRPTCPDGYALSGGTFQKLVCAPGLVEPVYR